MSKIFKVFVTCPSEFSESIINTISEAGGGQVGKYSHCAFITKGTGTFLPSGNATPFSGEKNKLNYEGEDKIEMICEEQYLDEVIEEILKIHPYESPTIDVMEIKFFTRKNDLGNFRAGS